MTNLLPTNWIKLKKNLTRILLENIIKHIYYKYPPYLCNTYTYKMVKDHLWVCLYSC